ncbi:MAG: glycosyltransferase family 2 protein [Solirubrobacteraceae bacterium]|nr:glycosyltransferase family 2 protein [Solirubrobacteraceae bacterium]
MKLSILLPTRNGGHQLEDCIRSVLSQPEPDLELVVSDNASDEITAAVLRSFAGDPRLHVVRQPEPLSVTDNWRCALEAASGDYVLLIGDDDCLLEGTVARLDGLLEEFDAPDVLSFGAYGYAFPGAFGEGASAYYSDPLFPYDERLPRRGLLALADRERCVRDFFAFDITFCPNLQTTLVSRAALLGLRNGPFKEPYPDFYAINALLLVAPRWAHVPDNLVVVGVSPKSFGRTLKGGGSDSGRAYLGIDTTFPGYLPGTDMVNGSHLFLERLLEDYGPELDPIEISRSKYVYRQGYAWYLDFRLRKIDRRELGRRLRMLSARDWIGFVRELGARFGPGMIRNHARVDERSEIASVWANMRPIPDRRTIGAFAAWVAPGTPAGHSDG